MPPKTKRQKLSAEAAALGREKLKERRLSDLAVDETPGPSGTAEAVTDDASNERTARDIVSVLRGVAKGSGQG